MLTEERKTYLLNRLRHEGRLIAKDISDDLKLSEDTIRRDLRDLARAGLLKRVHGGAVPVARANAPFENRLSIGTPEKDAIGRCAAGMIKPGQTVFLDGGTTALAVARQIDPDLNATLITHSPNVALELMSHERITVELVGGRLFRHSVVTTGAGTLASISRYRPDIGFIGAAGLHPAAGVTTGDNEEAEIKRSIITRTGAAYILCSSEKIGAISTFEVTEWHQIEGVIVAPDAFEHARKILAEIPCEIISAAR